MQIRSISATSAQNFENCSAHFYASNVQYVPEIGGTALPGRLGLVCHNALEPYVREVYLDKTAEPDWELLVRHLKMAYMSEFSLPPSVADPNYVDCLDMVETWFSRMDLEDPTIEVLTIEDKDTLDIKGIRFTYIFDRLDLIKRDGKTILRVVDYKTWRKFYTADALREKLQARFYAMAAMLVAKKRGIEVDEIWVAFDQLRYDVIELRFTRDENVATWKYVLGLIVRIQNTPAPGKQTPNDECSYCPIKQTCKALTKNVEAGGAASLAGDRDALISRLLEVQGAAKALKYLQDELEGMLLSDAMDADEQQYETENFSVEFKSVVRKIYDKKRVREIVGDDIFDAMPRFTNYEVDKLLGGQQLTSEQKSLVRQAVSRSVGEPKPKIVRKLIKELEVAD